MRVALAGCATFGAGVLSAYAPSLSYAKRRNNYWLAPGLRLEGEGHVHPRVRLFGVASIEVPLHRPVYRVRDTSGDDLATDRVGSVVVSLGVGVRFVLTRPD